MRAIIFLSATPLDSTHESPILSFSNRFRSERTSESPGNAFTKLNLVVTTGRIQGELLYFYVASKPSYIQVIVDGSLIICGHGWYTLNTSKQPRNCFKRYGFQDKCCFFPSNGRRCGYSSSARQFGQEWEIVFLPSTGNGYKWLSTSQWHYTTTTTNKRLTEDIISKVIVWGMWRNKCGDL